MRRQIALATTVLAPVLLLTGCGSGVRHTPRSYQLAGSALPVEVSVKTDKPVAGEISWRVYPETRYTTESLDLRAGQLWTFLPTETVPPDTTVEYYIDVQRGDKLHALGSPARPFATTFLDFEAYALAHIRTSIYAGYAGDDVRIVLDPAGQPIGQPTVEFLVPGLPGSNVAPMDPTGRGAFSTIIYGPAVAPGTWNYAIEVPIGETVYRIPEAGWHSFSVSVPPPPPPVHDHGHGWDDGVTIEGIFGSVTGPGAFSAE